MENTENLAKTGMTQPKNLTTINPILQTTTEKNPAHLPNTDINNVPKNKSVLLVIILSIITLGIYPAIWYMSKSDEFYNLGTKKKLGPTLPAMLIVSNILLIASIIIFPLTIDIAQMGSFYQRLSPLQTIILFAIGFFLLLKIFFSLLLAFYSRTIINQALENKESKTRVSAFLTFIFTKLYLQYEINKIVDDKEEEPKIGPWAFFLIILALIALGIVFSI
jgi:hypothetical protein